MNFHLTDDQKALIESAEAFSSQYLAPFAEKWDAEHFFPLETIHFAGESGFLGIYSPEHLGGLGLSRLDAALIFQTLSEGCTSTTAYMTIHNMVTWMVCQFAQPDIAETWGPKLTSGSLLGSYCLTEPNAGSDAASLKTTATLDGEHYIITGGKAFISGASQTDIFVVMARTGEAGPKGISAFLVPANTSGISYGKLENKMGWRSQPTAQVHFDQVRIPKSHLLGELGGGFTLAMKGLDGGRINIASCAIGTAQAALKKAILYCEERYQFQQKLNQFQIVQFKLGELYSDLVAAKHMVYLAASKLDEKTSDASAYCAMAKKFATDKSFEIVNACLQLLGGYGYLQDYGLERHLRDVRVHQILEGTNEIMQLILARHLLKSDFSQLF